MENIFFSMRKNFYIIFFYCYFLVNQSSYLEELISTSLYSENQNNKKTKRNVYSIYGHNKYCKKIQFYYTTEIKKIKKKQQLELSLLLINHNEHEQEIIENNKILLNKLQWHCFLTHNKINILPNNIIKKEINQNDLILFGDKHIPFGTLYSITFEIPYEIHENISFNINQYDKEFIICLSL